MLGKMVPPSAALEPMADDHGAQVEKATKAKAGSGKCICVILPTDLDGTTVGSWLAMEGKVRWGLYTCRALNSRRYDYPHRKMSLLSSERQQPFRQALRSLRLRFTRLTKVLSDKGQLRIITRRGIAYLVSFIEEDDFAGCVQRTVEQLENDLEQRARRPRTDKPMSEKRVILAGHMVIWAV
jgi:hypothetical protein